eukprot:1532116-Prymnesium_polylepis.1
MRRQWIVARTRLWRGAACLRAAERTVGCVHPHVPNPVGAICANESRCLRIERDRMSQGFSRVRFLRRTRIRIRITPVSYTHLRAHETLMNL